jgi:choice-of-anchor B domain-containing protein
LLGQWFDNSLLVNSTNVRYNDCWGVTVNNDEYAIIGSTEGVHFIDIEGNLDELDFIPGAHQASTVVHRDIKTFGNYVYAVCDEGVSSLQIIDASYLPDSVHVVNELFNDFVNVHNVFIDTANALLFSCSPLVDEPPLQLQRKLIVYSLADPENPVKVWQPDPANFPIVHDCYVRDGIAYLNCGDDGMRVYDFSNPSSPLFIQNITTYQDQGYNHQGWMTPDGSEFIFADETNGKRIKRCSVSNNQLTINSYFGTNVSSSSIPHNIMLSNDFAYVAYYNEGFRIYDISESVTREVAHFDTYPDESAFKMEGAWGVYSAFNSGKIIVSDRTYGLFVFDFNEELFSSNDEQIISVFPIPSNGNGITVKVNDPFSENIKLKLIDLNGKVLLDETIQNQTYTMLENNYEAGVYFLNVEYDDWKGDLQSKRIKILFD